MTKPTKGIPGASNKDSTGTRCSESIAWANVQQLSSVRITLIEDYLFLKNSRFFCIYCRQLGGTVNSSKMALTGHTASQ
jgi:hypothetical protein